MTRRSVGFRRLVDRMVRALSLGAALVGLAALGWILLEVLRRGASAIHWSLIAHMPTPPAVPGGGVANAIAGTLVMTVMATAAAVPIGFLAGIYLSEFGERARLTGGVRFALNTLMGIPSIIIGLFVYTMVVLPMKNFSGFAGAVALAIIMFPVVARTTEDMLRLVPNELRESALALGAPRWKVTLGIVFRSAKTGLITGALLAVARAGGETAPLLFTALNSPYWTLSLSRPDLGLAQPTGNLTVTIYNYAMSPFKDWQQKAWGASFLIMVGVLALRVAARLALQTDKGSKR